MDKRGRRRNTAKRARSARPRPTRCCTGRCPWPPSCRRTAATRRGATSSPASRSPRWRSPRRWPTPRSPACRADQRALRAAAARRRLRAAGLLAAADRRARGLALGARRRIGDRRLRRRQPGARVRPCSRCWSRAASCWPGCCGSGGLPTISRGRCSSATSTASRSCSSSGSSGKLLGLSIDAREPLPQLVEVVRSLGAVSWPTLAVGGVALAVLITLRAFAPKLPASLLVVVASDRCRRAWSTSASRRRRGGRCPRGCRGSSCRRRRWPTCSPWCPRPPACSC